MRQRCNNPGHTAARWYHDKGIRVCDEWETNYESFRTWALENGYGDTLTIDRIDPSGNYSPDNCRWITIQENRARAGLHKRNQYIRKQQKNSGRFMVVLIDKYVPYLKSYATVIEAGITKPNACRIAREYNEKRQQPNYQYSCYVSNGTKVGEKVILKDLVNFLASAVKKEVRQ